MILKCVALDPVSLFPVRRYARAHTSINIYVGMLFFGVGVGGMKPGFLVRHETGYETGHETTHETGVLKQDVKPGMKPCV